MDPSTECAGSAASGGGPQGADGWRAARVVGIRCETGRATTFRLDLRLPGGHRAGQHLKVRVPTGPSRTTSRSYSIASAPGVGATLDLTVERLDGGVVSGALHDQVRIGDVLEVRGPRGSFTWDGRSPALLVGGGSGLVPLMAMLRLARATGQTGLVRMVASARTGADLLYAEELRGPETSVVLTRVPGSLLRPTGRLTADDLTPARAPGTTAYVCGPRGFVDHVCDLLHQLGHEPAAVRTEAFGPSASAPG